MSPLLEFPDEETATVKKARKNKLNDLKEALKAKKDIAVKKVQKAYELFRCFIVSKALELIGTGL